MKSALIIGGTGFLGFHLSKFLKKKKIKIYSLSRRSPKKMRFIRGIKYLFADISNNSQLTKVLKTKRFDYVINFGGEVDHKKFLSVNKSHFRGVKNLTNIFLNKKIKKFIQVGSSLEYGKLQSPQKENVNLHPRSNYSKAKVDASKFLYRNFKKYNFPLIIARPYQVFGPYQDTNRFIPIIIKNCLNNKKFPCSNGKQFRDFLYIDDFINSIFLIIKKKNVIGETFNIGYGKPIKIRSIIKLIIKKIKMGKPDYGKIKLRKDENTITYPDITKIKKTINWEPKIKFEIGLNKTINFYKKNSI